MTLPLMLVDGNNLLVRAVEATREAAMTGDGGVSTAALVAFSRTLSRHIRIANPYQVVVCWDGGNNRRKAILPTYKATRIHTGNEYRLQSTRLADTFLQLSRIPQVRVQGEEADDLIAAYWANADRPVVILSSDKDLLQLTGTNPHGHQVRQLRLTNKGDELWDADQVLSYFLCDPEQLTLAMAIAGDASDNIDGVPRFGIKTAVKRMTEAGWDLDAKNLHHALVEHRDLIDRNLTLIDLRTPTGWTPPTVPPFVPTQPGETAWSALADFCTRHGLRQLINRSADHSLWG